jgi:hypothetical protein
VCDYRRRSRRDICNKAVASNLKTTIPLLFPFNFLFSVANRGVVVVVVKLEKIYY